MSDCRWFLGKTKDDKELLHADIEKVPAVILIIKSGTQLFGREFGSKRVACVADPEAIALWEAFLTTANVPKAVVFSVLKPYCELFWIKNAKVH